MLMIEYRWKPDRFTEKQAVDEIGNYLAGELCGAIRITRPEQPLDLDVSTEGDPFKGYCNQPDLRIYVFYGEDWNFTSRELEQLPREMLLGLRELMSKADIFERSVKIHFCLRAGRASSSWN